MALIKAAPIVLAGAFSLALGLAACSRDAADADSASKTPAATVDVKITAADANVMLEQVGAPTYRVADDMLSVTVKVSNLGKVALPTEGSAHPVRIGTVLLGPDGTTSPPGTRDFMRVKLPNAVAPGASVEAVATMPAAAIIDLGIQFELVQEGVAWFSADYKQPSLSAGPFKRCDGNAKSLCDANGTTVAVVGQPIAAQQGQSPPSETDAAAAPAPSN